MRNTCLLSLFSCFITHLTLGTTALVQPRLECYSEDSSAALGPEYPHVHTGRPRACPIWLPSLKCALTITVSLWQTLTGSRGYCRAPCSFQGSPVFWVSTVGRQRVSSILEALGRAGAGLAYKWKGALGRPVSLGTPCWSVCSISRDYRISVKGLCAEILSHFEMNVSPHSYHLFFKCWSILTEAVWTQWIPCCFSTEWPLREECVWASLGRIRALILAQVWNCLVASGGFSYQAHGTWCLADTQLSKTVWAWYFVLNK